MPNILVTGGLGFVGSHLVDYLVENPENNVVVIDDLSSESSSLTYQNDKVVAYFVDDIRSINDEGQTAALLSALQGQVYDIVYHLAARARIQPSFKKPTEYFDIDARGTCEVLDFARKQQARVVYAGSSSAYGGPKLNPYAFSKYVGEELCAMYQQVYGMHVAVARFFNVYGVRQPRTGPYATVIGIFEEQTSNNEPLTITGNGEQRRDFTHVSDIVKGLVSISVPGLGPGIFNLGTGRNYSINELASFFACEAGVQFVPARPGEAWITLADPAHTHAETGWTAQVALQDYIQRWKRDNLSR